MNSTRLQSFSRGLFALIGTRDWPARLAISARNLERGLVLAERQLFAATGEHPSLVQGPIRPRGLDSFKAGWWLCVYAVGLYLVNLLVIATISVRRVRWRGECGESGLCAFAPPGRTFETYRTKLREHGGVSVCIIGPKSWRQARVTTGDEHVRFETLLTTSPWQWIRLLLFLIGEASFVRSAIAFESADRPKSVARFLYVLLKQAVMVARADKICRSFSRTVAVLLSSEDLSLSLLEKAQANGHRAIHHLHGFILKGNMLAEPPLANALIVSCAREKKIFSEYQNVRVFPATIPFQMYQDILQLRSIQPVSPDFDILIIASFELPFLQKATYQILSSSLGALRNSRILLRHHPRVPESSRRLLEQSVPFSEISRGQDLVSDVGRARIVICCAFDPLAVCLCMKKPTVFLPMIDGNYAWYTRPFAGRLENLWCPDSSETMRRDLSVALSTRDWHPPDDYETIVTELVGSADFDNFGRALSAAMSYGSTPDHPKPEGTHD